MDATRTKTAARVLLVEDDQNIRELVELHLQLEGLSVVSKSDGNEALGTARADSFDLIVLDLMLPGLDGVTLCRAIRRDSRNADVPILMLTARRDEVDKVLGLDSGADDYLTKPFGVRELVARVRALLRRRRPVIGEHAPAVQAGRAAGRTGTPAGAARRARDRADRARVRPALRPGQQPRHRLQPRRARAAGLGRRYAHHGPQRGHAREAPAAEDRNDPADPKFILTVWGSGYKFADA